jgi:hypothetical protein|nr:hypothetical protein [bacterium]
MIYVVCIFAILAIIISWILIDMGISDSDKVTIGLGVFILAVVIAVGGCFYNGIKTPLVVLSLLIGLPMYYHACKSMAFCSNGHQYSMGDKIIGSVYWLFSMLFVVIGFYYWYYIPEYKILTIAMSILATLSCGYGIYWLFKGKSHFLPMMTAAFFASIVLYYGDVRGLLPADSILKYLMMSILVIVGMRYLIGFVHGINILHEPMK